jgi:hypothetical protein
VKPRPIHTTCLKTAALAGAALAPVTRMAETVRGMLCNEEWRLFISVIQPR